MVRVMKDSGVEWIGQIPSSWSVIRFQAVLVKKRKKIVYGLRPGAISFGKVVYKDNVSLADETKETYQEVRPNEFLINPINLNYDLKSLRTALSQIAVCVSPAYLVAKTSERASRKYVAYLLHVFDLFHMKTLGAGVRQTISFEDISKCIVAMPKIAKQLRIAAWLDIQTGRIDKRLDLLGEKRELLRQLKKSIIGESTFRGRNPDAELRGCGIEWLGMVPSHWKIVRLGSLFREAADAGIEGLPMLSVSIHSGISDKELDDEEMDRKVSRSADRTLYKRVRPGDLVYNQMRAWQGAFGAAKVEGLVSPAYVVARPGKAVVPSFIEHLLRAPAAMEEIRRRSRGITDFRLRLYWDEFKNIRIALPPKEEQEAIAVFLDRKLSQIDSQIVLIDQLEDLLKQQRKAIIHEAVTGKIDLSVFVPPQPQEVLAA